MVEMKTYLSKIDTATTGNRAEVTPSSLTRAATKLIEARGGTIVGIATIDMDQNDDTAAIGNKYGMRRA